MMTSIIDQQIRLEQMERKVSASIKLLQVACGDDVVEIAYSGGKDSDVILQLAKEAGIKYRAIYKNTTIDPAGTLKHVKDMGVEVVMPKDGLNFFNLVERKGMPSRFARFCCQYLKEYKIMDKAVMGVRKAESVKRSALYQEPTECRYYGSKKNHVESIYPILDWTDQDVDAFIKSRGIKCAPVYYDEHGEFHVERRLGCMCCPLASKKNRLNEFKKYPNMVKAYVRACKVFLDTHPQTKAAQKYDNAYDYFYREVFFAKECEWMAYKNNLFGKADTKQLLEQYFSIKFKEDKQ